MAPTEHHADVAPYALSALAPEDAKQFEGHLGECTSCQAQLPELQAVARLLFSASPADEVPVALESAVLGAVALAAADAEAPYDAASAAPRNRWRLSRPRRVALAGACAAVLAGTVIAGARLGGDDVSGTLELEAVLTAPDGAADASAIVLEAGPGRVVLFESDDLPILPEGELYELWFVGPGDTRRAPNRISAGTFHPDAEGRSEVRLHAAVDPAKYPTLSVTAEPGDGRPERTGPEVLRSEARGSVTGAARSTEPPTAPRLDPGIAP